MASSELAAFGDKIEKLLDPAALGRVVQEGGMAAKAAALEAAARDLGGDRSFSGMRRKAPLGAGFDRTGATSVVINFRPAGLWRLASQGRRSSGAIKTRGRGGKRALAGGSFGPVARSRFGPSRGLDTYDDAVKKSQTTVPKAAFRQFTFEIARVVG
jgi:hypothetical protein